MKGKIPIITSCIRCPHCICRGLSPVPTCELSHISLLDDVFIRGDPPDWCPLPDAEKLIALLERKGTNINDEGK